MAGAPYPIRRVSRPVAAVVSSPRVTERGSPTSSIIRPQLRGVADIYAAAASVPAGVALVWHARPGAVTLACLVYVAGLVILLVGSAVYHRPGWSLRTAKLLRKIDHANIYLVIAGTPTPLAVMLDDGGPWLLITMWTAAALGILKTFLWPHAPRQVSSALYVVIGALPLPYVPDLRALAGGSFPLLALGGALYLVGAFVYALRWPNPAPTVFGYHEVFHLFVFAAAASHFVAIWNLAT